MFKKNWGISTLSIYLILAISYAISPFSNPAVIGYTTLIGEAGIDILICIISIYLYYVSGNHRRRLFAMIATAFFFEAFADGAYNFIQNILGICNPSIFLSSLYEVPLLLFLCLQGWFWWELFFGTNTDKERKKIPLLTYVPFIISSLIIITIFIYSADWKINRLSSEGLYQFADIVIEAADFALVSICLVTSGNKNLSCIAIGFLIIVCSNYMIRLPVVALATAQNSPFEFTWITGQLLVFYGLSNFKKESTNNFQKNWCYGIDYLQSQIAVGSFGLGLVAIALFSILIKYTSSSNSTESSLLQYLPVVMIILSIITVILSAHFSKKLLKPLKELEAVIEIYSQEKIESTLSSHKDYGIREYIELKVFIKKALFSLNKKLVVERETSTLAASISHDMASPLAVMDMILNANITYLPSHAGSILKDSIQEIRDITRILLEKYRNPNDTTSTNFLKKMCINDLENQKSNYVLLHSIIETTVAQKRIEWATKCCEITVTIQPNKNIGYVLATPEKLKRIISNLLNNAYEALQTKKQIDITIGQQDSQPYILISDSGCGIKPELFSKILAGKSLKHPGRGFGLSGAKIYMESLGGLLSLTSSPGLGTQIKLLFPPTSKDPQNFQNTLTSIPE